MGSTDPHQWRWVPGQPGALTRLHPDREPEPEWEPLLSGGTTRRPREKEALIFLASVRHPEHRLVAPPCRWPHGGWTDTPDPAGRPAGCTRWPAGLCASAFSPVKWGRHQGPREGGTRLTPPGMAGLRRLSDPQLPSPRPPGAARPCGDQPSMPGPPGRDQSGTLSTINEVIGSAEPSDAV